MKYKFISFEGIEGCGKSTQTKMLQQFLTERKYDAIITREPGGVQAAENIRKILLDENIAKLEAKTEIFLNFAARIEHIEKLIKPAIANNKIVISDRFFDSTFAYQGYGMGIDNKIINEAKKLAIGDFTPNITFLIDMPVEVAFKRIANRAENNRYEKFDLNFHQRIRSGFLEIASKNKERIFIIDGAQDIKEIAKKITDLLGF